MATVWEKHEKLITAFAWGVVRICLSIVYNNGCKHSCLGYWCVFLQLMRSVCTDTQDLHTFLCWALHRAVVALLLSTVFKRPFQNVFVTVLDCLMKMGEAISFFSLTSFLLFQYRGCIHSLLTYKRSLMELCDYTQWWWPQYQKHISPHCRRLLISYPKKVWIKDTFMQTVHARLQRSDRIHSLYINVMNEIDQWHFVRHLSFITWQLAACKHQSIQMIRDGNPHIYWFICFCCKR